VGQVGPDLLVLVGVAETGGSGDVTYLASKIPVVCVFEGDVGKAMDRPVNDVGGALLVVLQLTLNGDTRG
jgi:D-tyrosyl-tRNA(Tyr) deacylase